ncbi:hypothetical protein [Henriciella litoralis]|nr:hypothetical protein [Henriciella litoralis]
MTVMDVPEGFERHFKTDGSLCFTAALILADGEPVSRASATFKIVKARKP